MPQYVRHSGVWREVKEPYVRHSGAWRSVKEGYVRHSGVWRQYYRSFVRPPAGSPFGGGFYAGANIVSGGQEYALVVAPRSQGGLSATTLQWKTDMTSTTGTDSRTDGLANSNAMNNTSHPAARFCRTLNINGHNDWYLPSFDELEICYRYLKPTTDSNNTSSGANSSSNPVGATYTSSDPAQTSSSIFRQGGGEDFRIDTDTRYWSSTQSSSSHAWRQFFSTGGRGTNSKTFAFLTRAVRRVPI